jgi:hypothetical protein
MAVEQALEWLRRRGTDPAVGWLSIDRMQQAFRQVYRDMAEVGALSEMVTVVLRRRIFPVASIPVDSWVTVEHGLGTEHILVQAYLGQYSIPVRVKVHGPDVISVLCLEPPTGPVTFVVIG